MTQRNFQSAFDFSTLDFSTIDVQRRGSTRDPAGTQLGERAFLNRFARPELTAREQLANYAAHAAHDDTPHTPTPHRIAYRLQVTRPTVQLASRIVDFMTLADHTRPPQSCLVALSLDERTRLRLPTLMMGDEINIPQPVIMTLWADALMRQGRKPLPTTLLALAHTLTVCADHAPNDPAMTVYNKRPPTKQWRADQPLRLARSTPGLR
jgi:hypothetical protein